MKRIHQRGKRTLFYANNMDVIEEFLFSVLLMSPFSLLFFFSLCRTFVQYAWHSRQVTMNTGQHWNYCRGSSFCICKRQFRSHTVYRLMCMLYKMQRNRQIICIAYVISCIFLTYKMIMEMIKIINYVKKVALRGNNNLHSAK